MNRQLRPIVMRKRPSTVEAWYWDGTPEVAALILEWVNKHQPGWAELHPYDNVMILGDDVDSVKPTDWVVRDKFGEFWPLPDHVFGAVYESLV